MAGKVKDRGVCRRCPHCRGDLERFELAGDEREVVVAEVCRDCGFSYPERVEVRRNKGGGSGGLGKSSS
jgi:hypothetical protein